MNKLSVQMDSDETQVCLVAKCIRCYCEHHLIDGQLAFQIVTCVMEAINNVLEHALTGEKDQRIIVVCKIKEESIVIEVFDRGLQMTDKPSLGMPALDSEQGRGWNILRRWMDEVSYRRHRGENRLRLKKNIYATTK